MLSSNPKLANQREAGIVMKKIFNDLNTIIKAGITKEQINEFIDRAIKKAKMIPSFKNFHGYPSASCIAINEEVVHALPNKNKVKKGDMVTVDIGIKHNGYHVDAARTYFIEPVNSIMIKMRNCAHLALNEAIKLCRDQMPINNISHKIEQIILESGFYPIAELTGHGVGESLQESPSIPNVSDANNNQKLHSGMSVAIEPIFACKKTKIFTAQDSWTILTNPPVLAIQVEDTVHITDNDPIILTN